MAARDQSASVGAAATTRGREEGLKSAGSGAGASAGLVWVGGEFRCGLDYVGGGW